MKNINKAGLGMLVAMLLGCTSDTASNAVNIASHAPVTIYKAGTLITLAQDDDGSSNAVAVQDGKIISVGELDTVKAQFNHHSSVSVDTSFEDRVMMPGFVEPHIHLWLSAILMGTEFITPSDWALPHGYSKGVQSAQDYNKRLIEVEAKHDADKPLVTWGYHQYFHGQEMNREFLDSVSDTRPIIVWHRSFHELYFNTAAIKMFGWQESDWTGEGLAFEQMDWNKGHVFENGGKVLLPEIMAYLVDNGLFAIGMERTKDYVHAGGITTAVDPGVIATKDMYDQMVSVLMDGDMPMDYWLIPAGNFTYTMGGFDATKGKEIAESQRELYQEQEQIRWLPKHIKLFSDGAMYSQLMQLKDGYLDGRQGEWMQPPEQLEDSMRPYWKDDYTIIVHANGDLGFEAAIDVVETLAKEQPREDHRTGFHHLGITDKSDISRAVEQGSNFSVNPYYTHILAENYSENGVGKDRAEVMARGQSIIEQGGLLSLHSDAPMAPAQPLSMVWAAVNRIGLSGTRVMGAQERISVDEALRAITINAAYTARLENEIGTIEVGKYADFAVLDANPYKIDPKELNTIEVDATIYRGSVYPVAKSGLGMQMTMNTQRAMMLAGHEHDHGEDHDVCSMSLFLQNAM
ncbi:amidohydrolase [Shewanella sp. TC10]|uniref:amidohydrolase n=1 Tax=Shewanella sp. TC10 TaxID=1419739 RepID=UPI001E65A1BE|nr:amidohydrolase family protein [Shewanella sp. TC10]